MRGKGLKSLFMNSECLPCSSKWISEGNRRSEGEREVSRVRSIDKSQRAIRKYASASFVQEQAGPNTFGNGFRANFSKSHSFKRFMLSDIQIS